MVFGAVVSITAIFTLLMIGAVFFIIYKTAFDKNKMHLQLLTENTFDLICELDSNGVFLYLSSSCKNMLGYDSHELLGTSIYDLIQSDEKQLFVNEYRKLTQNFETTRVEFSFLHKNGDLRWAEATVKMFLTAGSEMRGAVVLRDITDKKKAEQELLLQTAYFQQLFENSPEGIAILDNDERVISVNKGFENLFHFSIKDIKDCNINEIIVPNAFLHEADAISAIALKGGIAHAEAVRKRKDGSHFHVNITAYAIMVNDKQVGIYAIYRDITTRKQTEEQLEFYSLHDTLTGLFNRNYFEKEMRRIDEDNMNAALIICDVDGLKLINDTLGHDSGDSMLIEAAKVIRNSVKESDIIARIGGDEFAVLLPECRTTAGDKVGSRIREEVEKYNLENPQLPLSISIGVAARSGVLIKMNEVFKEADNNMYREKLHRSQSTRSAIVNTLTKALEARDFITEGHADRLQGLVADIAASIGMNNQSIEDLQLLAQFHDIGKVGIPDRVLFKQGTLTLEEAVEMQRHCEIGYRIARSSPDLAPIADWILKHHEWWNGEGYPLNISGREIPLESRILSIADAYDAMTSDRPYRKALPHDNAVNEIKRCAGIQFDPDLVIKFMEALEKRNKGL